MILALLAPLAAAQDWPGGQLYEPEQLNADPFRPALDPGALLATESAQVPEQLTVRADLTEAHNPLVWISENGEQVNLIGDALGLHLGGPVPKVKWLHLYGGTTAKSGGVASNAKGFSAKGSWIRWRRQVSFERKSPAGWQAFGTRRPTRWPFERPSTRRR